jgi:Cft2 family RNA processing exonuclease
MMALPYITEHTGFTGTVYATEPTVQIGRWGHESYPIGMWSQRPFSGDYLVEYDARSIWVPNPKNKQKQTTL